MNRFPALMTQSAQLFSAPNLNSQALCHDGSQPERFFCTLPIGRRSRCRTAGGRDLPRQLGVRTLAPLPALLLHKRTQVDRIPHFPSMMAARVQRLLLCVSVAALLVVMPCCTAARSLRTTEFEPGTRSWLSSTSAAEDDTQVPRNEQALSSAPEKETGFNNQWARFQVQEVAADYNPAGANPDPGNPSPMGD